MANRRILRVVGLLFWLSLCVLAFVESRSGTESSDSTSHQSLIGYIVGPTNEFKALDPTSRLRENDPVFFQDDTGEWFQVGYVGAAQPKSSPDAIGGQTVEIAWHHRNLMPEECDLIQYRSSGRLEDVIAIMLPDDQRERIAERLSAAMSEHGDQLAAAYIPLVQETFQKSLPVVEEEFRASVARHRNEMDALLAKWNDHVLEERLIPLAKREILPIVRKHGEPEVEEIGRELWDKASLWRFAWRAVYDRSPLPKQDLVQEEWDRFVQEQAVPVFESHMDDIVIAIQRIVSDVAANEQVRAELSGVAGEIAADPETRDLVRRILKETFVDNKQLRTVWTQVWTSDNARQAFELTSDRLEPVARQIGDDLFGTREGGINPNFARVLRNQILGKDRRWIVARQSDRGTPIVEHVIVASDETMAYPMVYLADERVSR